MIGSLIVFIFLISVINNYFFRSFFFLICWFFVFYWLFSTFIFLYKKSQYSIYTSIIQGFWKRALYLFWLLELFLFCIYLFLTLITPQETLFLMDYSSQYFSYVMNFINFFKNIFNVIVVILLTNLLILTHKYNSLQNFLIFLVFIMLVNILIDDFIQFFNISQFYNNVGWKFNDLVNVWELEAEDLKLRTLTHYFFLLIFLKIWHTVFIIVFFLFFENIILHGYTYSYNILASFLQNFYFLLFFAFILKIILMKGYMNYLYEYVYYWFFINFHFYDLNHLFTLFSAKYICFLLNDVMCYFF